MLSRNVVEAKHLIPHRPLLNEGKAGALHSGMTGTHSLLDALIIGGGLPGCPFGPLLFLFKMGNNVLAK
jgi:hypothetical protein